MGAESGVEDARNVELGGGWPHFTEGRVRLEQGSRVESGQANASPGAWWRLGPKGGSRTWGGHSGQPGRSHTEGVVTKGVGAMSERRAGKGLCCGARPIRTRVPALLSTTALRASHLSSLSFGFLLRWGKVRPLSKVCKGEGRPCMQRPGRAPYAWSMCSVNDIFPVARRLRTSPGRQLRLLLN